MLRVHRPPTVRLCLLLLAAALSSTIVLVLAASADPSRAAAASSPAVGLSVPAVRPASKAKASHRKSSSARRAECAAAARTEKARRACGVKKAKARGIKPSASPKPAAPAPSSPPSVVPASAPVFAIAGPPPAEALAVPAPESTPPVESPGGSITPPVEPPVEPKPPVELKAPIEPIPPVEEPKPPVEEPQSPVEEPKVPVEEPKAPVEEPKAPVEEPKAPVEEPKAPVEEPKPPVEAPPAEKASTTTTLVSSTNPSPVGQAVVYTATISSLAATGTVEFTDNGTAITGCTAQPVSSDRATCTVSSYATTGSHSIRANYRGDENYLPSNTSALTQEIDKASVTITLSSGTATSNIGQAVTYTATMSAITATGIITFDEEGTPITGCTARNVDSGSVTCTVMSYATAGSRAITAAYSGDGNYLASTSPALIHTVNPAATTTALVSSANPVSEKESVTYTAAISALAATGTVTFEDGGSPIMGCGAQMVSFGSATCSVTGYSTEGTRAITASYSGDSNYLSSTSSVLSQAVIFGQTSEQTTGKTSNTTTIMSSLNPSTVGQAVTYSAKLNTTAATGTIIFKDAGAAIAGCTAQPIVSGTAACTVANLAAGYNPITAVYSGDSSYAASTSPALSQIVDKRSTETTILSSANPSAVGQAVIYTAKLNTTAATGTVSFKTNGETISGCSAQPVSSGSATCTVSYSATGWPWITAVYSGDNTYAASTSPGLSQVIHTIATTTTLASSLNPSTAGQAVTYTAKLNTTAATGTIEFKEAGKALPNCATQTVHSGSATCTVPSPVVGSHWVTSIYSGDNTYATSTSAGLSQIVNKAATSTTMMSSLNPSTVGQAVTYSAKLNTTAATGTIIFKDAGAAIAGCTAQPIVSGTAACTVANLAAGYNPITAVYSGDSSYAASTSAGLSQIINKTGTETALSSPVNPSTVGQAVTYTATVNTTAATGTITFKANGEIIPGCSAQPVSSGSATCTVSYSATGWPWITAIYSGDGTYAASTSPGLSQVIHQIATTASLVSSLNPSTVGHAVTYTAKLNTTAAAGTVEFREAGKALSECATQTIKAGLATCVVPNPGFGSHWVTAIYSGDNTYATSTSAGLSQAVNKTPTSTTIMSSLNPSAVGQTVIYTVKVNMTAATGTVAFKGNSEIIPGCIAQPVISGMATCAVSYSAAGWPWITAVYSGDGTYASSTSPGLSQTINKASTTTTVSSSANPSTVGQTVTYTAAVNDTAATGTITFKEEETPIPGCITLSINSGTASCTVPAYTTWTSYAITASYGGDANYLPSPSPVLTQSVEPPVNKAPPFRFFAPTSFWNEELAPDAALDPSSMSVLAAFNKEISSAETSEMAVPTINTSAWSVPIYTVPADQPTVKVTIESSSKPATLQAAWDAVPLPADAKPAVGTDKHLVVSQPSTDRLWEFWGLESTEEGWKARWGGAIEKASSSSGIYGPEAWPGANTSWGASATSLSIAGGLITLEDLERGEIDHVLAIAIPAVRAGVYASPAERTDGESSEPTALPEGARLRLDPGLDLAALHLPRLTLMMAEAAQRYGIVVRDRASNIAFYAQDPTPTGANPYAGVHGYFEGKSPAQLLADFPWSHLELLKMTLH